MLQIEYLNQEEIYHVGFRRISPNVIELLGNIPIQTDGFQIFRSDVPDDIWDYSDYTTVYREIEGGVQYSNDGSVYTEPETYIQTEAEQRVAEITERISVIDAWFATHDYIGIKIATGRATAEEYADIITQMDEYAKEKEALLAELKEVQEA